MRLLIEILVAAILLFCITATSAAFAGKLGRSADGLSCGFSVPQNASPAQRCDPAPMRRQVLGELLQRLHGVGGEVSAFFMPITSLV